MQPLYETREHPLHSCNLIEIAELEWIPHWHDDIEIMLLLKGTAILAINDESYTVRAGTVCIINSRDIHAYKGSPDSLFQLLLFSPALIPRPLWESSLLLTLPEREIPSLSACFRQLSQSSDTRGGEAVATLSTLCSLYQGLLMLFSSDYPTQTVPSTRENAVDQSVLT